jgi:hypothetical protein
MEGPISVTQDDRAITIDNQVVRLVCAPDKTRPPRMTLDDKPALPVLSAVASLWESDRSATPVWSGWAEWMASNTTLTVSLHAGPSNKSGSGQVLRLVYYRNGNFVRPGNQLVLERTIEEAGRRDVAMPKITYLNQAEGVALR